MKSLLMGMVGILAAAAVSGMRLNLAQSYEGPSFFDAWTYNASEVDLYTVGNVQ